MITFEALLRATNHIGEPLHVCNWLCRGRAYHGGIAYADADWTACEVRAWLEDEPGDGIEVTDVRPAPEARPSYNAGLNAWLVLFVLRSEVTDG